MTTFLKDPAEVLDYEFEWSDYLADGETIVSYTVTVPAGITKNSDGRVGSKVTAWLSGGSEGVRYEIDCTIVTSEGRTAERSMQIRVQDR